jgi:PDZ domain
MVIALGWLCTGCVGPVSQLPAIPVAAVVAEERTQEVAQIRDFYGKLARLDTVAFRIRLANREFCQHATPQIGLYAAAVPSLPRPYRSFVNEAINVSWTKATAISVVPGSPADSAGIKAGDRIMSFDAQTVPARHTSRWIGAYLVRHGGEPLRLTLRRGGVARTVTVAPVMACATPVELVPADDAKAVTTDDKIVIGTTVVALARTDAQLAVVVGRELALVNLDRSKKQQAGTLLGAAGGTLLDGTFLLSGMYTGGIFTKKFEMFGAHTTGIEFEREADYLGAYYAARAGYDVSGAEEIWRAIGQAPADSIRLDSARPIPPQRFLEMRAVAVEIADKQRRRLPLLPELNNGRTPSLPAVAPGTIY